MKENVVERCSRKNVPAQVVWVFVKVCLMKAQRVPEVCFDREQMLTLCQH